MELIGAAILAAAVIGLAVLVAVVLVSRHPTDAPLALLQQGIRADVALLQQTIADLRSANAQSIGELRSDVQRSLGATEQQLLTQSGSTQRTLGELGVKLASLGEQSARIGELAKDIGSLHDLFRAPKLRGGFGELMLERLLADNLPAGAYELQYGYRDGSRVDAVVRFAGRLVPIDAKFPIESFNAMAAAADDAERASRRRSFVQQVKRHVDAVARYISPADQTIDYAFLYFPAEGVYYAAAIEEPDLREYCAERHVLPTSPNTLVAYLQMVSLGLRGLAMEERSRELHEGIRRASLEVENFRLLHETLGKHLENATKKYAESLRGLDRAADAIAAVGRPLASAQQPQLPLTADEDERGITRLPYVAGGDER
ncbi:MAG TPA: DNA recombination protein RmuC [Candidatus Limnocylindria bacterium]|nr:DNA recombination protein RmuC [Candidatus Limnocylindria bacterium]